MNDFHTECIHLELIFFVFQQEHKWKMFLEIDGDETALLLVKVSIYQLSLLV